MFFLPGLKITSGDAEIIEVDAFRQTQDPAPEFRGPGAETGIDCAVRVNAYCAVLYCCCACLEGLLFRFDAVLWQVVA